MIKVEETYLSAGSADSWAISEGCSAGENCSHCSRWRAELALLGYELLVPEVAAAQESSDCT